MITVYTYDGPLTEECAVGFLDLHPGKVVALWIGPMAKGELYPKRRRAVVPHVPSKLDRRGVVLDRHNIAVKVDFRIPPGQVIIEHAEGP